MNAIKIASRTLLAAGLVWGLAWWLLRIALLVGVVIGAVSMVLSDESSRMTYVVVVMAATFLYVLGLRRRLSRMETILDYCAQSSIALMDYMRIGIENESTLFHKERGWDALMVRNTLRDLGSLVMPGEEPVLTTQAYRDGKRIRMEDDIRSILAERKSA